MTRVLPSLVVAFILAVAIAMEPPAIARPDGENLQIVLRTDSNMSLATVRKSLKTALRKISPTEEFRGQKICDGEPIVREITPAEYTAYQRLTNPDAPLATLPTAEKDGIQVRQLPAATPTWEFSLKGTTPQELTKLEVVYEDAPKKPELLEPNKGDNSLTLTQFGSYALTPPALRKVDPGAKGAPPTEYRRPLRYTAYVRQIGGKGDRIVAGEWPKGDNYYLIRVNRFRGLRKDLSDTITDPDKVPNGPGTFEIRNDVTLVLGTAKSDEDVTEGIEFEGNKLYVTVPKLNRGKPKRAYMLFPLNKQQFDSELASLRGMGEDELPAHIRKNVVGADREGVITADTPPTWFELPLVPANGGRLKEGTFGRVLSLTTADTARASKPEEYKKLLDKIPQAYQIVVYEFDDGTDQVALQYKRGDARTLPPQIANGGEMTLWPVQLHKLAELPGAAPKPKE